MQAKIVFVRLLMFLGLFNRFGPISVDFTLFNRFERNPGPLSEFDLLIYLGGYKLRLRVLRAKRLSKIMKSQFQGEPH